MTINTTESFCSACNYKTLYCYDCKFAKDGKPNLPESDYKSCGIIYMSKREVGEYDEYARLMGFDKCQKY